MIFDFHIQAQFQAAQQHAFHLNAQCQSQATRLGIQGESGSGKTLLLHTLAGLMKNHSGSLHVHQQFIQIAGITYADSKNNIYIPPQQRQIGLMFQDYALFPHLTVAQNIAFGLSPQAFNPSRKQLDSQTQEWLAKMQLTALAHHYPHQISGGQKQRTALARACITQPRCLLLDEPFSALDARLRQTMRQEIKQLLNDIQIPMLLITHDPADCEALTEEVWQMKNGTLNLHQS